MKENDDNIENEINEEGEKEEKDEPENFEKEENDENINSKKREIIGPRIKMQKKNKKEDKELQEACEDSKERKERLKEEKKLKEKERLQKKEEDLKNKNLIYRIDEENYKCADCQIEKPTVISINNGITICNSCAQQHQILGHSISYLKNINEKLDEYLFNFIVFGSNTRFKKFILTENIDGNLSIKKRYKTQALYFYRKMLKAKVFGKELPIKEYNDPNEIVENNIEDDYPEFNKYIIKNQIIEKGVFKKESKLQKIFNKLIIGTKEKNTKNVLLLRARSSVNEELKKENVNTNEGDDINKINIFKKPPPSKQFCNDIKESERHINENEDTENVVTTSGIRQTEDKINKKENV